MKSKETNRARTAMVGAALLVLAACSPLLAQESSEREGDIVVSDKPLQETIVTGQRSAPRGSAAEGYRLRDAEVGPFGNLPLLDTPFSVSVTSGDLIENRIAKSPTDALKTNPAVAPLMSSGGYSSMHRVMIRGFSASDQNELRDGLTDRSWTLPPMEDVERIEVFQGMSGFLYGFSAIGGSVNSVTKKPLAEPYAGLSAGVYESGIWFGQADLGGALWEEGLTSRLNLYAEDGSGYIDGSERSRQLISGVLGAKLFEGTELDVRCYHQRLDHTGLQTYFNIQGIGYRVPDAFDPAEQYGQPWTFNDASKTVVDIALDSKINEVFSFRTALRYGDMSRDYRYVGALLTDTAGHYTETYIDSSGSNEWTTAAYALLDAEFETGELQHKLTFGYTHWGFTFERGKNFIANLGPSDVLAPRAYAIPGEAQGLDRQMQSRTHNFLIGDFIELTPAWSLLAGVNYALLNNELEGAYLPNPRSPSHISQEAWTPTVGIIAHPAENLALYASYMQGLEQGGTAPAFASNAFEVLDATVSDQFEIGAKSTLWNRFDLSAGLFCIEKVNQYYDTRDKLYKADGLQVHEGVEVQATGRLLPGLTLVGGLTALSAEVTEAPNNPATEGHTPKNVPERQARLYLEYDLPGWPKLPGAWTLACGVNYYGERPVNLPNTGWLPEATTFDAGLRYSPKENLIFNFTVSNLFDEHYWSYYRDQGDGIAEDGLLLGDPRLISASVKYEF